jgi:biotin carboxyl carrier protein
LLLPAVIAHDAEFDSIRVDDKLEPTFPERLDSAKTRAELHKGFAPLPSASSDEIVTPMGGHFYAREAPHLPPLAHEGMHFTAGQPLFVIEVMKMFNKVSVPFSGTITKLLLPEAETKIVTKGQVIFKIEPDHKRVEETPEQVAERKRALTDKLLAHL